MKLEILKSILDIDGLKMHLVDNELVNRILISPMPGLIKITMSELMDIGMFVEVIRSKHQFNGLWYLKYNIDNVLHSKIPELYNLVMYDNNLKLNILENVYYPFQKITFISSVTDKLYEYDIYISPVLFNYTIPSIKQLKNMMDMNSIEYYNRIFIVMYGIAKGFKYDTSNIDEDVEEFKRCVLYIRSTEFRMKNGEYC
jgi:hypothetical protein